MYPSLSPGPTRRSVCPPRGLMLVGVAAFSFSSTVHRCCESDPHRNLAASVLLVRRQNRSPGVSRCQFTDLRRVGHVIFGGTVVQVVTVVEPGAAVMRALAAIHIAGDTACSFGLVPLVSFGVASGPSEISSSLALRRVPDSLPACPGLYPFSPPPHLNNRPLLALPSPTRHYTSPSPPSIPLPVLCTPRHLSALMPPPSPPSLPSRCGQLVFKLKFT